MNVLITNDDGIESEGLIALKKFFEKEHNTYIIAPLREQSCSSHSLTMNFPLRVYEYGKNYFAVDGTPTDCIMVGVNKIFENINFDLLVSGINYGGNLGDDITYSGTVAAAMEGCLLKIPSIAVSIHVDFEKRPHYVHYDSAIFYLKKVLKLIGKINDFSDCFFNLNVPDLPVELINGLKITKQGKRTYKDVIVENKDPRGKKYYWIAGTPVTIPNGENTDLAAIEANFASLTPLHLDLTNYKYIEILNSKINFHIFD